MNGKVKATPAARRIARERGIRLEKVPFDPEIGHIRAENVLAFREKIRITPLAKEIAKQNHINDLTQIEAKDIIRKSDVLRFLSEERDEILPVKGMRKAIAEAMVASKNTAPQYTVFADYDMYALKKAFAAYKQSCPEKGGIKPTFTDVFVKLFALALLEHPMVNSTFTEEGIVLHKKINVGIAVAVPDGGLIVPNIKDADKKSLKEITKERAGLVAAAREHKLQPADITGGTFTISNLGGFPVDHFTPIINQPESAIAGLGRTIERVVPFEGGTAVHPVMGMSFTFDHRHIDGAAGAAFMASVMEKFDNAAAVFAE